MYSAHSAFACCSPCLDGGQCCSPLTTAPLQNSPSQKAWSPPNDVTRHFTGHCQSTGQRINSRQIGKLAKPHVRLLRDKAVGPSFSISRPLCRASLALLREPLLAAAHGPHSLIASRRNAPALTTSRCCAAGPRCPSCRRPTTRATSHVRLRSTMRARYEGPDRLSSGAERSQHTFAN